MRIQNIMTSQCQNQNCPKADSVLIYSSVLISFPTYKDFSSISVKKHGKKKRKLMLKGELSCN